MNELAAQQLKNGSLCLVYFFSCYLWVMMMLPELLPVKGSAAAWRNEARTTRGGQAKEEGLEQSGSSSRSSSRKRATIDNMVPNRLTGSAGLSGCCCWGRNCVWSSAAPRCGPSLSTINRRNNAQPSANNSPRKLQICDRN